MHWLRRVHIWVGLFNFTALIVFACTALAVTVPVGPAAAPDVRRVDYTPAPAATDIDVATDVFRTLALPQVSPVPDWAIRRNDRNQLELDFYGPNGRIRVTVLEDERHLRVERLRNGLGEFLTVMHATTLSSAAPSLPVRLWAIYVDASIFSLLFMIVSGVWLWLAARPHHWWARGVLLAGVALFVTLWVAIR